MKERKMTEKKFWKIVKWVDWKKDHDDMTVRKLYLLKNLSYNEIVGLRDILTEKFNAICDAEGSKLCYDTWTDCVYQIIGEGKEEFDRNIANPDLIRERLESMDIHECFGYVIPYVDDVVNLSTSRYKSCI